MSATARVATQALAQSLVLALLPLCVAAATQEGTDERTGLPRWDASGDGVRLRLVQRLPDQTRAFFLGRGFSPAQADRIAAQCVLQTILTNAGDTGIESDIADWSASSVHGEARPRREPDWQTEWEAQGVAAGPRIAFRWALFPNRQQFAPGDWNMGMTTWPVPPGTEMDVHIRWRNAGELHELTAEGVRCATHAAPATNDTP